MKVRAEFESTPIRHIAVQCPDCLKWFSGRDILNGDWFKDLRYDYQIDFANFHCPICDNDFGYDNHYDRTHIEIEEVGSVEECYKGCYQRKEIWHNELTYNE